MNYETLSKIRNIISKNTPAYMENNLFPDENITSQREYDYGVNTKARPKEPGFWGKVGAAAAGVSGEEYGNIFGENAGANYQLGLSSVEALHALGGAKVSRTPAPSKKATSETNIKQLTARINRGLGVNKDGKSLAGLLNRLAKANESLKSAKNSTTMQNEFFSNSDARNYLGDIVTTGLKAGQVSSNIVNFPNTLTPSFRNKVRYTQNIDKTQNLTNFPKSNSFIENAKQAKFNRYRQQEMRKEENEYWRNNPPWDSDF